MTVEIDVQHAREQLVMINPQPYNAEAPSRALDAEITPTREHYVRKDHLTFVRSLALAHSADPGSGILIAYDMNDEPLEPDHGSLSV